MKQLLGMLLGGMWMLALPAWGAQWYQYPEKGIPRKADGTLDVNAPAPRLPDGKPDLSGLWLIPDINDGWDLEKGRKGGLPLQPWARKLVEQRAARELIDDPSSRCLPTGLIGLGFISPFRISVLRDRVIVLFEQNTTFRQILLDGRPLPTAPLPSYMGYSVGRWEGETFVVESAGFNGKSWIDAAGHPITEQLHLTERIKRPTFGRLEIELTFDDPSAYAKPWTLRLQFNYVPDSELTESFCEDNKFVEQLKSVGLEAAEVVPQGPSMGTTATETGEIVQEKIPPAPAEELKKGVEKPKILPGS